jgi:hypothetical protein
VCDEVSGLLKVFKTLLQPVLTGNQIREVLHSQQIIAATLRFKFEFQIVEPRPHEGYTVFVFLGFFFTCLSAS